MYTFHTAHFRQVITEKGWSLAALARALNTPVSTVSGWVNGRHQPTLGNVERLVSRATEIPQKRQSKILKNGKPNSSKTTNQIPQKR